MNQCRECCKFCSLFLNGQKGSATGVNPRPNPAPRTAPQLDHFCARDKDIILIYIVTFSANWIRLGEAFLFHNTQRLTKVDVHFYKISQCFRLHILVVVLWCQYLSKQTLPHSIRMPLPEDDDIKQYLCLHSTIATRLQQPELQRHRSRHSTTPTQQPPASLSQARL